MEQISDDNEIIKCDICNKNYTKRKYNEHLEDCRKKEKQKKDKNINNNNNNTQIKTNISKSRKPFNALGFNKPNLEYKFGK